MTRDEVLNKISEKLQVVNTEAELILEKAEKGGEIHGTLEDWLEDRFLPNVVFIDEDGYARMCIDALKILATTVATDYGSSRQRDLGQLWADMTRGYLGELAFQLYLKKNWNLEIELGHEKGEISEFLSTDIHGVRNKGEVKFRIGKIKVGIKATKWNGIWCDIPGDQFNHSNVHVLVKVGTGRDHLFAYFKKISVFKDKVLRVGQNIGLLSSDEADTLYDNLPTFRPIPAYICGFVQSEKTHESLSYEGKKGRKNYNITAWKGPIVPGDLEKIKTREGVTGSVKFEGIGKFAHDKGYLFNAGNLLWRKEEWDNIIKNI